MDAAVAVLPSESIWANRRVLVTGHSGFKGAWLTCWLNLLGARVLGLSLPEPPTSPHLWGQLGVDVDEVLADIRDESWIERVRTFRPEVIFHLAAQPIVAIGYRDPLGTFEVNVQGLTRLLESMKSLPSLRALIVITTDKVYDPRQVGPYVEGDFLGGADPYSASKASAELVVSSWPDKSVPVVTGRAGNVIGGGDWSQERLIPDLVRAWHSGHEVKLRRPEGVRPWQHVLEPLRGYLLYAEALLRKSKVPSAINFGPNQKDTVSVAEIVEFAAQHWSGLGRGLPGWDRITDLQYGETANLTLDSSLASSELGWRGVWDWQQAVGLSLNWYSDFLRGASARDLVYRDISAYSNSVRTSN